MLENAQQTGIHVRQLKQRKDKMQVVTTRSLEATLKELIGKYHPSNHYLDPKGIETALKDEGVARTFQIPAADDEGYLTFNNRELLCRFALLPIDWQKSLLACIRKAMNDQQVVEIHLVAEWSSGNKRTIKVRRDTSVATSAEKPGSYGKGNLNFY